jgi:hypothetical protein
MHNLYIFTAIPALYAQQLNTTSRLMPSKYTHPLTQRTIIPSTGTPEPIPCKPPGCTLPTLKVASEGKLFKKRYLR